MSCIYIHIPFCKKRCAYCDFFSQTQLDYINIYIQAVVRELEIRKDYLEGETVETIYWGGGTPSLLQPDDFELVFDAINRYYPLSPDPEITLEANPDDMSREYVSALRHLPFNRISMGVQSFHEPDLRLLNRRHTAKQAMDAVALCQHTGYSNLSIDLIYGLPGQTLSLWEQNVNKALQLQVPHLSAYHLSYEEGTDLHRQLQTGTIEPVSDETSEQLFNLMIDKADDAGYVHYEISNFGKPGCFSKHNTAYWTDRKYIGVGAAAHSYDHCSRQWNVASLPDYMEGMMQGRPIFEKENIDERKRYNEYLLTRLRTMWGIQLSGFQKIFGDERLGSLLRQSKSFLQTGLMEKTEDTLRISRKGLFVSDGIVRELIIN